jgi:hypothetical protein
MLEVIGAVAFVGALVVAPLLWREWADRREGRALAIRADVQSAVTRRLQGESFVSVQVTPGSLGRPGRVALSTPSGWEWLIDEVWVAALERVPEDYEVVVKPRRRPATGDTAGAGQLGRAA